MYSIIAEKTGNTRFFYFDKYKFLLDETRITCHIDKAIIRCDKNTGL